MVVAMPRTAGTMIRKSQNIYITQLDDWGGEGNKKCNVDLKSASAGNHLFQLGCCSGPDCNIYRTCIQYIHLFFINSVLL